MEDSQQQVMGVSVETVVQSHLSDAMVELSIGRLKQAYERINFVKRLVFYQMHSDVKMTDQQLTKLWGEVNGK